MSGSSLVDGVSGRRTLPSGGACAPPAGGLRKTGGQALIWPVVGAFVGASAALALLVAAFAGLKTGTVTFAVALSVLSMFVSGLALRQAWRVRARLMDSLSTQTERARAILRKVTSEPAALPAEPTEADALSRLSAIIDALEGGIDELIEQRQQREREVMRADQLAMVGQVAAGFAHEIRNPLTAVKMLVQAGRKENRSALPSEDLDVIEHEIRRMERSLQRFLDFARPPRPERRPLDVRLVVGRVLTLLQTRATRQRVKVSYRRPELPAIVDADEDQIQQLVMNLVMNALDAMPSGGALECTLEETTGGVELRIADTGPGIPEDLLPRLFDPFISTKETGIGLGLAVSFRIAENHGGRLSASNRPEGGACFVVRLPGAAAASSEPASHQESR